jgi:hypothetical protein
MNIETRQKVERMIVRHLVRTMKEHAWLAMNVDNGGGWEPTRNESEVMYEAFASDEAWIQFRKNDYKKGTSETQTVYLVLGNDGYDVIADYTYKEGGEFKKLMEGPIDEYSNLMEERYA